RNGPPAGRPRKLVSRPSRGLARAAGRARPQLLAALEPGQSFTELSDLPDKVPAPELLRHRDAPVDRAAADFFVRDAAEEDLNDRPLHIGGAGHDLELRERCEGLRIRV